MRWWTGVDLGVVLAAGTVRAENRDPTHRRVAPGNGWSPIAGR